MFNAGNTNCIHFGGCVFVVSLYCAITVPMGYGSRRRHTQVGAT